MAFDRLYERSPLALQDAAVSLMGLKFSLERYGLAYWRHKRWLVETEARDLDAMKAIQREEFLSLLRMVTARNDFYRQFYRGISTSDFRSVDDITRLPILTKELLRENIARITMLRSPRGIRVHTGGTTGTPLSVVFTRRDFQRRMAVLDHYREKFGFENGMPRATFSGRTIVPQSSQSKVFWRHNHSLNQRLYSTFHLKPEYLDFYIHDLNAFAPAMIDGFPSAIHQIALRIVGSGAKLDFRPKVVFTTSETLYDSQRELFESVFGCPIANQYASSEGAPFVVECPAGKLHYDLRTGIIEEAEDGGALVTSFTTHGTPLIRYTIGDQIILDAAGAAEKCSCGNPNPVVRAIVGRSQDYLVSRERGIVAVGLIDIFKKVPPIFLKSQIVQTELDAVELNLVPERGSDAQRHFATLEEEIKKRMGGHVAVRFKIVADIEREKSGKFRYILNKLPREILEKLGGAAQ